MYIGIMNDNYYIKRDELRYRMARFCMSLLYTTGILLNRPEGDYLLCVLNDLEDPNIALSVRFLTADDLFEFIHQNERMLTSHLPPRYTENEWNEADIKINLHSKLHQNLKTFLPSLNQSHKRIVNELFIECLSLHIYNIISVAPNDD